MTGTPQSLGESVLSCTSLKLGFYSSEPTSPSGKVCGIGSTPGEPPRVCGVDSTLREPPRVGGIESTAVKPPGSTDRRDQSPT